MKLAVSLWFAPELEQRIRNLWALVSDSGIDSPLYDGRYRPHITLGVWETARVEALTMELHQWSSQIKPFDLRFASIGVFPGEEGVVFTSPVVTTQLLNLHAQAFDLAGRHGVLASQYYQPGCWTPHCTIAWRLQQEEVAVAAKICLASNSLPVEGCVEALGVIETPTETELSRIPFSG